MTPRAPRLVFPLLLLVLLLPAAAGAQSLPARTKTARPPAAAQPAPAPAPAAPAPARAPARADEDAGDGAVVQGAAAPWFFEDAWRVAPLLGVEVGTGDTSYTATKVRVDVETTVSTVGPRSAAAFVLSVGALHASDEETIALPALPGFPSTGSIALKWAANVFDLVPTARLRFAPTPKVWFHADGGLGVAYTVATGELVLPAPLGKVSPVADGLAGVVRLGGGLTVAPDPNLRFGALVGLDLRFGDGMGSAFSLLVSASHRF